MQEVFERLKKQVGVKNIKYVHINIPEEYEVNFVEEDNVYNEKYLLEGSTIYVLKNKITEESLYFAQDWRKTHKINKCIYNPIVKCIKEVETRITWRRQYD